MVQALQQNQSRNYNLAYYSLPPFELEGIVNSSIVALFSDIRIMSGLAVDVDISAGMQC